MKNLMNKTWIILLALALASALVSCSKKRNPNIVSNPESGPDRGDLIDEKKDPAPFKSQLTLMADPETKYAKPQFLKFINPDLLPPIDNGQFRSNGTVIFKSRILTNEGEEEVIIEGQLDTNLRAKLIDPRAPAEDQKLIGLFLCVDIYDCSTSFVDIYYSIKGKVFKHQFVLYRQSTVQYENRLPKIEYTGAGGTSGTGENEVQHGEVYNENLGCDEMSGCQGEYAGFRVSAMDLKGLKDLDVEYNEEVFKKTPGILTAPRDTSVRNESLPEPATPPPAPPPDTYLEPDTDGDGKGAKEERERREEKDGGQGHPRADEKDNIGGIPVTGDEESPARSGNQEGAGDEEESPYAPKHSELPTPRGDIDQGGPDRTNREGPRIPGQLLSHEEIHSGGRAVNFYSIRCVKKSNGKMGPCLCGGNRVKVYPNKPAGNTPDPCPERNQYSRIVYGELISASEIPLVGEGFQKINYQFNKQFGTGLLVNLIKNASAKFREDYYSDNNLLINAMTFETGGPLKFNSSSGYHASHQNGLDADLAFLGNPPSWGKVTTESGVKSSFDIERNYRFWKLLVDTGYVNRIFVHKNVKAAICTWVKAHGFYEEAQGVLKVLRPDSKYHKEHWHLRLKCLSSVHPRCIEQAAPTEPGC